MRESQESLASRGVVDSPSPGWEYLHQSPRLRCAIQVLSSEISLRGLCQHPLGWMMIVIVYLNKEYLQIYIYIHIHIMIYSDIHGMMRDSWMFQHQVCRWVLVVYPQVWVNVPASAWNTMVIKHGLLEDTLFSSAVFLLKPPCNEWISQLATFDESRGYPLVF